MSPETAKKPASAILLCTLLAAGSPAAHAAAWAGTAVAKDVVGYIAPWEGPSGYDSVLNNIATFTDVSISAKTIDPASPGRIVDIVPNPVDFSKKAQMQAQGIGVEVLISNLVGGDFNKAAAQAIVNSATARARFVDNAVAIAMGDDYDGVELDFENLDASDRANFTALVKQLAAALHANDKYLFVSVFSKDRDNPEGYPTQQAQDWVAIGKAADQVRLQGYGYCWGSGCIGSTKPGSTSPNFWLEGVLAYATKAIAREKITLGLPLYGYDYALDASGNLTSQYQELTWKNDATASISNPNVLEILAAAGNPPVNWEKTNANGVVGSSYFDYTTGSSNHQVRFANQYTARTEVQLGNAYKVTGYAFWRLGGEDPSVWNMLRNAIPKADVTAPSLVIQSPANGAVLSKSAASNVPVLVNVGDTLGTVTSAKYYIDGSIAATRLNKGDDQGLNWSPGWNVASIANGIHTLKVVAYDQAGNSNTASIKVTFID